MINSRDADYEDDLEDEASDHEDCPDEGSEEDAVEQIAIDRISDTEWQICDFASGVQPATYLLIANKIEGNKFENMNFMLVECDCDNFDTAFEEYQVFQKEIWSACMFIADDINYEAFTQHLMGIIPEVNLSNPVELAYMFGGKIHHRDIRVPPMPYTH